MLFREKCCRNVHPGILGHADGRKGLRGQKNASGGMCGQMPGLGGNKTGSVNGGQNEE